MKSRRKYTYGVEVALKRVFTSEDYGEAYQRQQQEEKKHPDKQVSLIAEPFYPHEVPKA